MRNSSRSHFVEVVLPAFETFTNHYASREIGLRRDTKNGSAIAEALRDLPEHVYLEFKATLSSALKNRRDYRELFWPTCPAYEVLCDFANAWKHLRLTRTGKTFSSLEDVQECILHVRYEDEKGYYYGLQKMVVVKLSDGREWDLRLLVNESLKLWLGELVQIGVLAELPPITIYEPAFQSRASVAKQSKMRILGQVGEYLEIGQKISIFRNDTNTLVPVQSGEEFNSNCDTEITILPSPLKR